MLGKAMRFVTVCALAFAICGEANRGKTSSFSEGTTEDLEHRFGQETNSKDLLSTTMETPKVSVVKKLAAILALSSALTSADAFAAPGVQTLGVHPFQKGSNTAFAPIHTNNPLHGAPSGPLHASIAPFDGEEIKQMAQFVQDAVKGLAGIDHDADVQNIMAAMKDFHPVQAVQAADFPAVGAPVGDVGSLEAPVQSLQSLGTREGIAAGIAAPLLFALGTIALESEANPQLASASEAFRSLFSDDDFSEDVSNDVSEDAY